MRGSTRDRRRVAEAVLIASALGGAPSTLHALVTRGGPGAAVRYGIDATRAIGTLVPPGRPGFWRGALAHGVISVVTGAVLARALPRRHSIAWGAAAGLVIGLVNVGVIGRRFPHIRALPLGPQLADNVAFAALFAAVADRR